MSDRDSPPPALGARKSPGFGPYGMRSPLSPDTLEIHAASVACKGRSDVIGTIVECDTRKAGRQQSF
jgi:hypothetical protein